MSRQTDYILDETFLDFVFQSAFERRGTYFSTKVFHTDLEEAHTPKRYLYNDVVMALEQLERDSFLSPDGKWENYQVYRLTYQGFIEFKSSKNSSPYVDLIRKRRNKKIIRYLTTSLIASNAFALLLITGLQVYFQIKDDEKEQRMILMERNIDILKDEVGNLQTQMRQQFLTNTVDSVLNEESGKK